MPKHRAGVSVTIKRVGWHEIIIRRGVGDDWAIMVEPEGLRIDNSHKEIGAHIHPLDDPKKHIPIKISDVTQLYQIVKAHLARNDKIIWHELTKEVMANGD